MKRGVTHLARLEETFCDGQQTHLMQQSSETMSNSEPEKLRLLYFRPGGPTHPMPGLVRPRIAEA